MSNDDEVGFGVHMKEHGHLWDYHCKIHNSGHGGVCFSCKKERKNRRVESQIEQLQAEIKKLDRIAGDYLQETYTLQAENEKLKEIVLKVVEVKMYSYKFWKKAEQALKGGK